MNDKTIINTISKVYFVIISFLSFIFLTFSAVFIILQNGIYIDDISLPNIKAKQLYIKWNEKLDLSVKEVLINVESNSSSKIDLKNINDSFKKFSLFHSWFEHVVIDKIIVNDIHATFNYKDGEKGFLIASSPTVSLKSSLEFDKEFLNFKIDSFKDLKRKISVDGNIVVDTKHSELTSSLNIDINNEVFLDLLAYSNNEKLFYKVTAPKEIKDITHTMELLPMYKEARYWAYKAFTMSGATLNLAHGWLEYRKPGDAYKNVYVSVTGHDLSYTYNPKLDPVDTQATDIEYKKGVLYIRPKGAYSYNFYLDKSWLKIDFTKKEELLTLHLLFNSRLNKDILHILSTYGIKVPFLQNSGNTKTNLKIAVNLRTIDVDAKGDFFTKKANFNYKGINVDVEDLYLLLDNYDIKISNMFAKYKDIATANVDAVYDAKSKKGKIDFSIKDVDLKSLDVPLHNTQQFRLQYVLSPEHDSIKIENTHWLYSDKIVDVDKVEIPFDLNRLELNIPATFVKIPTIASAYVSGSSFLKTKKTDLDIDLLTFKYRGIELSQSNTPIKLKYDKKLSLASNTKVEVSLDDTDCIFDDTLIDINKNKIDLRHSKIDINDILKADISGKYDLEHNSGLIRSKSLKLEDKKFGELFFSNDAVDFNISNSNGSTTISSLALDTVYKEDENNHWYVDIKSLNNISQNSRLLQDYNVTKGDMHIEESRDGQYINFLANLKYPYKVLVSGNKPVENYAIDGKISKISKKISLKINDSVNVSIKKDIKVKIRNSGIDLNSISKFMKNRNFDSNDSSVNNIMLSATDSYFYLTDNRHIVFDFANMQYYNKILTAQFIYGKGKAGLKFEDDKFHIYGENFNDKFMEHLFALSKFKGGSFEFSMDGTTSEYDGIFHVKDTIVIDYKVLNNILAFVNTIPSLITFSIPGYNSKGLAVKNAYMNFHAKDNVFDIKDVYLDSQEIDILGRGTANFNNNTIDVKLNLKTDLGSKISKVPVVGYILLDGNTIATTLSITGALDDPDVKSLIARDIVVAPLNIVKRVLTLPYHLLSQDGNVTDTADENSTKE